MEIFIVIVLVLIVFVLWVIKDELTIIKCNLINIDRNLEHLPDKFNPPESNQFKWAFKDKDE